MKCENCIHYNMCNSWLPSNCSMPAEECCSGFEYDKLWVKLPCKIGDTVYFVCEQGNTNLKGISEGKVISFSVDNDCTWIFAYYNSGLNYWHTTEDIGKEIFFIKEDALNVLHNINNEE